MRSALAFDVAVRWFLRSGYKVTYVRNVTDIDDKILTKSQEEGQPWWAHAYKYEQEFAKAYRDLGTLTPTYEPHATAHIPDQIALVQRLIDAGYAYSDGHGSVYFDVHSLKDYGSLTHQRLEDLSTTEDESQIDQRSKPANATHATSPSGRQLKTVNRKRPNGTAPGVKAGRGGTWNAQPCRGVTLATNSTFTPAE